MADEMVWDIFENAWVSLAYWNYVNGKNEEGGVDNGRGNHAQGDHDVFRNDLGGDDAGMEAAFRHGQGGH